MFTHSNNSQFQYLAFLVGRCHTADEAYRILSNELENRDLAINTYQADQLARQAEEMRLRHEEETAATPWERLKATAELAKMRAAAPIGIACYEEALRERDFIQSLITKIQPHRKYAALPDHEAMQACQREEWAAELKFRAENFLLSEGRIPADHFGTMRLHPDFEADILPHVETVLQLAKQGRRALSPTFGQRLMLEAAEPKLLE